MDNMLINDVISIAREAGRMMSESQDILVEDKGTKDNHVTNMDIAIQEFLKQKLTAALPESSFIGEESDYDDFIDGYCWIVDPIDGTTNFIRHIPVSVTSIGLVKDGVPVMGVVYNPYTDEMYHAEEGRGAYLNDVRIHVSERMFENSIVCLSWGAYDKQESHRAFALSEELYSLCEDIRRTGAAAYELCKIAEGCVEILFEPILYPWDHAAASVIITEAGGHITGISGKANLRHKDLVFAANSEENLDRMRCIIVKHY
jgi:myo-inositol-1(or 4)-monophosphatase